MGTIPIARTEWILAEVGTQTEKEFFDLEDTVWTSKNAQTDSRSWNWIEKDQRLLMDAEARGLKLLMHCHIYIFCGNRFMGSGPLGSSRHKVLRQFWSWLSQGLGSKDELRGLWIIWWCFLSIPCQVNLLCLVLAAMASGDKLLSMW